MPQPSARARQQPTMPVIGFLYISSDQIGNLVAAFLS
jgi:hypothetical protein